jgi:hypothetical protein
MVPSHDQLPRQPFHCLSSRSTLDWFFTVIDRHLRAVVDRHVEVA